MNQKISEKRKAAYYIGTAMMALGFILFISVFFTAFSGFGTFGGGIDAFTMAPIGMVLMIAGSFVRAIGARGLAGSGVILDPQQAREDLEPHTRAIGGMVSDALDEIKTIKPQAAVSEVIKVRCPQCGHLNDESDKYCAECGAKI